MTGITGKWLKGKVGQRVSYRMFQPLATSYLSCFLVDDEVKGLAYSIRSWQPTLV
jgi:hypothetical protein